MRVAAATLAFMLLIGCCSADLTANYNIVLEENGNSLVTLVVTGLGTINVPLPLDVKSPAVRDALYVKAKNGVEVAVDAGGQSTIVYTTALLTSRQGSQWRYSMLLPDFEAATVVLYVPENAVIHSTSPQAAISHIGRSKSLIWNVPPNQSEVVAEYSFTEPAMQTIAGEGESDVFSSLLFIAVPLAVAAAIVFFVRRRGQAMVLTRGKQNVLKALTANESKIVNTLLHAGGGMRRNDLERQSGIAKSSLASSLYNLEQRNIIQVDKNTSVHYVEVTEWFKSL